MAVIHFGFEYDMGLVADGFTLDPRKTEEESGLPGVDRGYRRA
jgi:hypothetical protein